jgi:hypothetical protein
MGIHRSTQPFGGLTMPFLPFDLDHHLAAYNETARTPRKREDFNFLQALMPESTNALGLANELSQKSAQLSTLPHAIDSNTVFEEVKEQITQNDYQGVRISLNKIGEFIENDDLQSWYIEQQRRLSNPDLWEQIIATPRTKRLNKQILTLRDHWLSAQAGYSAHSISALWFVGNNIVSLYDNYYRYATLEFRLHRFKIPKELRQVYEAYLVEAQSSLQQFKETLCQAMLDRLQLATKSGDITYNDYIHSTAHWLVENNLIMQQNGLPATKRNDLTPEYFHKFTDYINRFGNPNQQKNLDNLGLFSSNDNYTAWRSQDALMLAPSALINKQLIPKSEPWFPRIFENRYFRYQFIQKNLWLFSSLKTLNEYPLNRNSINHTINHFRMIDERLELANQEIQEKKFLGLNRILQHKTVLFTNEWAKIMLDAQTELLQRKIDFIRVIHQQLIRDGAVLLEDNLIRPLLEEITGLLAQIHLPQQQCEQFYLLKAALVANTLSTTASVAVPGSGPNQAPPLGHAPAADAENAPRATLAQDEAEAQIGPYADTDIDARSTAANPLLPRNIPLPPSNNPFDNNESENRHRATNTRPASNNPFVNAEAENIEPAPPRFDHAILELVNNLRIIDLDLVNFHEMIGRIKQSVKAIRSSQQLSDHQLANNCLDKIFTQYLQKCISLKKPTDYEKCREKFSTIEELLSAYAPNYIKDRVQAIREIPQQPNYWFLFQLKCRSYLASCQQKLTPYLVANSVVLKAENTVTRTQPLSTTQFTHSTRTSQ